MSQSAANLSRSTRRPFAPCWRLLALVLVPSGAWAHGSEQHLAPSTVAGWWTWDPWVISGLLLSALLYTLGVRRLWGRAGVGQGIRWWEAGAFALSWCVLVLALLSPLDRLSDILFSAHMSQHELLMLVAAPLFVLGKPLLVYLWALPAGWRQRVGGWFQLRAVHGAWRHLTGPFFVLVLHALTRWVWHVPVLFEAALLDESIHALQHATFFGTAAFFWWALIHGRYGRLGYGVSVLFVFATAAHTSILGAVLTFAPRIWYPLYGERTSQWGLSPLEDQQLAGLLMWIPGGALLLAIALGLFAAWLGTAARRQGVRNPLLPP